MSISVDLCQYIDMLETNIDTTQAMFLSTVCASVCECVWWEWFLYMDMTKSMVV